MAHRSGAVSGARRRGRTRHGADLCPSRSVRFGLVVLRDLRDNHATTTGTTAPAVRGPHPPWRASHVTMTEIKTYQQFIGGRWVDSASGETQAVENPAVYEEVARVPASGPEDGDRAVDGATAAEAGPREPPQPGKRIQAAIDEMAVASDLFRFFAGACRVLDGLAVTEFVDGKTSMVRRDPVGVVASIAPWNYPLYMAAWKLGPALAPGNPCVLKPASRTPLSALRFAEVVQEALPAGVLNVITGSGATMGDLLVGHPKVRMVSITGDTVTGKHIAEIASRTVKRLHLELGGKAPGVVYDDADVALVAATLRFASYWNSGQDCTAACRVIAGPGIYENLLSALADRVRTIKWGNPAEHDDLDIGSLIAKAQADKVEQMVDRALAAKAELVVGGHRPTNVGAYYEPTVLANPDQKSEIVQEEVFGPVVTVQRFANEEQAISWANDVKYGLSSSVFTGSIGRAMRTARRLQFGTGGVHHHLTP